MHIACVWSEIEEQGWCAHAGRIELQARGPNMKKGAPGLHTSRCGGALHSFERYCPPGALSVDALESSGGAPHGTSVQVQQGEVPRIRRGGEIDPARDDIEHPYETWPEVIAQITRAVVVGCAAANEIMRSAHILLTISTRTTQATIAYKSGKGAAVAKVNLAPARPRRGIRISGGTLNPANTKYYIGVDIVQFCGAENMTNDTGKDV